MQLTAKWIWLDSTSVINIMYPHFVITIYIIIYHKKKSSRFL